MGFRKTNCFIKKSANIVPKKSKFSFKIHTEISVSCLALRELILLISVVASIFSMVKKEEDWFMKESFMAFIHVRFLNFTIASIQFVSIGDSN